MTAARRFFVEGSKETGATVEIYGGDAHKITRVLRLRAGDRIEIVDSGAHAFQAAIEEAGPVVRARLLESTPGDSGAGTSLSLQVAQAVPKGSRMDFVIEKGTELGADAFLPFYCERSIGRRVGDEKLGRWRRIARTAAQQCGRRDVPDVREPVDFERLVEAFTAYDAVLFAWELASQVPLQQRLAEVLPRSGRVLVAIGPEGGFSHAEAEAAMRHGAAVVWLGSRILRTDTAALALLAVIAAFTS